MLIQALEVLHIVGLGYWLGSELVINSTYRYVCWAKTMPFEERQRLMGHVMAVDQHVRFALVLQAGIGLALAAWLGYVPGGDTLAVSALVVMVVWLGFVEWIHRVRHGASGAALAHLDRLIRYGLLAVLIVAGGTGLAGLWTVPGWLALKLILFAAVISCGVGIRISIIGLFRVWAEIAESGTTPEREAAIRRIYVESTSILGLLWVFIVGIAVVSVWKPF